MSICVNCEKYKNNEHCIDDIGFCEYQLAEHDKQIRTEVIEKYMSKLCEHCMQQTNECYKLECPFCTDGCDIINIAERLKENK